MATREEYLELARGKRALAAKARDLASNMSTELAQTELRAHANALDLQAEELEIRAKG
jgi:hypothetical protein